MRSSRLSLSNANPGKLEKLGMVMDECYRVVNLFIDELWERQTFYLKFIDFKVDTWLSARMQHCLGMQALGIVKSQRKRKKLTKPIFSGNSFDLADGNIDIQELGNYFDMWIRLKSIGNHIFIKIPVNKHYHYNKFKDWNRKGSFRLYRKDGKFYIDILFEKPAPSTKLIGKSKAIDIGYKKLIVSSDNERIGDTKIYEKIARKRQGSNAFKRALIERDEAINVACKSLDLKTTKTLYVEDLKNVKRNSKGKIHKQFMNKLQRWSYPKVLSKLSMLCEEQRVSIIKIPPAYTSQRCSSCGVICKTNRNGESYKCACGCSMDADLNAALNILHLGRYGSPAIQNSERRL